MNEFVIVYKDVNGDLEVATFRTSETLNMLKERLLSTRSIMETKENK